MKHVKTAFAAFASISLAGSLAAAQSLPADETNVLILVDVSGSMSEPMTAGGDDKLTVALGQARDYVRKHQTDKNVEFALWAFDTSYGDAGYTVIQDFPGVGGAAMLALLGEGGTPSPELVPKESTPLAKAGCSAASRLACDRDTNGVVTAGGYEWDKSVNGRKQRIDRRLYIATDGLENAGATGECAYDISSGQSYQNYESNSWQYKLRNKLLTGNANTLNVANNGLTVEVDLVFKSFLTGLSGYSSEGGYSGSHYDQPTLPQALEFYSKIADQTSGTFHTVTVNAAGALLPPRYPGDVDYSGCVSDADLTEMGQWYGYPVDPAHPHSYWPDLNADGWVDDLDYIILAEHWQEGPTC